jgi:hypothetical protein
MKRQKYYIAKIYERNGEMEYSDQYLFKTSGNPQAYAKNVAKSWRGHGVWDSNASGYWHGEAFVWDGHVKEIPEEHYKVMHNYIVTL